MREEGDAVRRCTGGSDLPGAGGGTACAILLAAQRLTLRALGAKQVEAFLTTTVWVQTPADIFTLQSARLAHGLQQAEKPRRLGREIGRKPV